MSIEQVQEKPSRSSPDGYRLPDHWILPLLPVDGLWVLDHEAYVQRAVELTVASGAKNVLEVGCGDGWNCSKLTEAGLNVVGIDFSSNGVRYAEHLVPNAKFLCGDITDAGFKNSFPDPFDAVVFIEVIEHIPPAEVPSAMRAIRDCIKTGGTMVVTTPSVNLPNNNSQHYRHFTPELLQREIESGGFCVKHMEGYGDAVHEKLFWKVSRLFNNRYYTLHPVSKWLFENYRFNHTRSTPVERARGLIAVAEAI